MYAGDILTCGRDIPATALEKFVVFPECTDLHFAEFKGIVASHDSFIEQ
jgi:hypothetical protein